LQRPVRKLEEVDPGAKPAPSQGGTDIEATTGSPPNATADRRSED
jgi:hypothetical protein